MHETKRLLSEWFRMKDLDQLHYCLGVNIVYGENCVWLHQKQYITLMLKKFELMDAKTVSTPADHNVRLVKDDTVSKATDQVEYQSMIGSLLYAAIATRPDIAQAVGVVSNFVHNLQKLTKLLQKEYFDISRKPKTWIEVQQRWKIGLMQIGVVILMIDTQLQEMFSCLLVEQ